VLDLLKKNFIIYSDTTNQLKKNNHQERIQTILKSIHNIFV